MKQELKDTVKRQLWTEVETEQRYGSEKEDLHLLEIIPSTLLPRLHKGERTDYGCRGRFHPSVLH